jgi:hypothetical protein
MAVVPSLSSNVHGMSFRSLRRHEFLKEMLQARADNTMESTALAGLSDEDLDGMLARTPEELAILGQMNEPAPYSGRAASECTPPDPSKAHEPLHLRAANIRKENPPPIKCRGSGKEPGSGKGHNADTRGPLAAVGKLGSQTHVPSKSADAGVSSGVPGLALGARMASPEEVRWMVEAAELVASPVAVAEDFGRGKRQRTVGSYKESDLKDLQN